MNKKTYDEVFKNRLQKFFESFATVITEYEILKLPKKIDILIIETNKPIQEYVSLFVYFKKFNIIEFKSESDRYRLRDLYKSGIYISGILLKEKDSHRENTTYTVVSTNKPRWMFQSFQFTEIKKGLYKFTGFSLIEIYIVVVGELEFSLEKEIGILKAFTVKKERERVIHCYLMEKINNEILEDLYVLYESEIVKILERMGKDMTVVQERVIELAEKYGIREKIALIARKEGESIGIEKGIEQGIEKGIEKGIALVKIREKRATRKTQLKMVISLKKKGMENSFISEITSIDLYWLARFFQKIKLR